MNRPAAQVTEPSDAGPSLAAASQNEAPDQPEVWGGPDQAEAEVQPGTLRARFLRPRTFVSFGIAIVILIFFVRRLDVDPAAIWRQSRQANPWVYAAAFVVWYSTFILRAIRWRMMLARAGVDAQHGYKVPGVAGVTEILVISWFINCVVPAKLGDAYRSYLIKQETKASFSTSLGTVVAERLIDLTVMFGMMSLAVVIVFSGHLPTEAQQSFWLGLGLILAAAVGLGVMWFSRRWLERLLPERFQAQYARLHGAIFACLRRPEVFVGFSVVIWLMEGMRLWLVAASLDAGLPR